MKENKIRNNNKHLRPIQMRFDTSFVDFSDQIFGRFALPSVYPTIMTSKSKANVEYAAMHTLRELYNEDMNIRSNRWQPDKTLNYAIYVLQWLNAAVEYECGTAIEDIPDYEFKSDNIFKFNAVWQGIKTFITTSVDKDRLGVIRSERDIASLIDSEFTEIWTDNYGVEITKESLTKLMMEFGYITRILELTYKIVSKDENLNSIVGKITKYYNQVKN